MLLLIRGHDFHYETENLCRVFFPYEPIKVRKERGEEDDVLIAEAAIDPCGAGETYTASLMLGEKTVSATDSAEMVLSSSDRERKLVLVLFDVLTKFTGYRPAWGILTGVHPIKLFRSVAGASSPEDAVRYFTDHLLASDSKAELARRTAAVQEPFVRRSGENSYSLYASVPFCPTRCSYCSFVSQTVERSARLIPEYVDKLCEELTYTAQVVNRVGLELDSVYIGGGTPTTFSAEQLARTIQTIRSNFDLSKCTEFTVEAGRPDTITKEKLIALKENGVTRISINPQSLNDQVLRNIGRAHSAQQILDAFALARSLGFDNINMDLIAGLPGDTPETFKETLDAILALGAENITVHALALKHSARMMQQDDIEKFHRDGASAAAMVDYTNKTLTEAGFVPYYLYRQSRMVGNLENTGWSKPGYECAYNIYTMDETQTVVACGAGGVTKVRSPYSERLERIFNFKYSYEYVSRFHEMLERKDGIEKWYEQFRQERN
ncbi:MAG: coproporphyrinogen dehydrogenase HemZ [Clostridia bacterium]|nr:coproporphyrinogen dehydrogenase HemZ [Clostridia bacterium]